jgi:DHA1 family multidrug resistance protein-like MFS transporter
MESWRKNLYVLWGTQFLAMLGMNLVVPFLPFFIRSLGVTDPNELARWSGLVFAGPFVLSFIATPLWGTLGDRYGRRTMVIRAIFGLALSQLLMGFSQNVVQLLMFRVLQGAISGFIAATLALVSTTTPKERMGYAMGLMQSASAGGMVLGPFFGGVLADLFGYRPVFFITAAFCTIAGFIVIFLVTEPPPSTEARKKYTVRQNLQLMLSDRRLRLVAACLVVGQVSVLMVEPVFALFIESFKTDSEYISTIAGGIFSIAGLFMVVSAPWWGKRNDRKGQRKNIALAFIILGFCYAGHLIVQDLFQLGALRAFLGFARGGILPALYALAGLYAPADRQGGIMAIASSMTILGNLIGPTVGGLIAGHFGISGTFVANSIMLVAMGAIVWRYLDVTPAVFATTAEPPIPTPHE